ncbi:MAG: creatininase family protein [Armatimonadia bacterium]
MPARYVESFSSPEYEKFLQTCDTAVIGVASIETHGPHLSLCADPLVGEGVLQRAADRVATDANLVILPTIKYAIVLQHGHERNPVYPGNIGVTESTLMAQFMDIAGCLARDGFRKLLIFNMHGGNSSIVPVIAHSLEREYPGLYCFHYMVTAGMNWGGFGEKSCGHGCASETSLNLALNPQYTWMETNPPENEARRYAFEAPAQASIFPDWCWVTRGHGYVGDPKLATAEAGEKMIEGALGVLVPTLEQLARLDVSVYEPVERPNEMFV